MTIVIFKVLTFLAVLYFVYGSAKHIQRVKKKLDGVETKVDRQATKVRKDLDKLFRKFRKITANKCDNSETKFNFSDDYNRQLRIQLTNMINALATVHGEFSDVIKTYPDTFDVVNKLASLQCPGEKGDTSSQSDRVNGGQDATFDFVGHIGILNENLGDTVSFLESKAGVFDEKTRQIETEDRLLKHMKNRLKASVDYIRDQTTDLTDEHVDEIEAVLRWQKVLLDGNPFQNVGGRTYFIESEKNVKWTDALRACHRAGGYLAEIYDKSEETELASFLLDSMDHGQVEKLWLGSKRGSFGYGWAWHHSEADFGPETKVHYLLNDGYDDCLLLHKYEGYIQLEAESCGNSQNFICEFD